MSEEQSVNTESSESQESPQQPTPQTEVSSSEAKQSISDNKAQNLEAKVASGEKLSKKEEKALKEYKLKVNGREKTVKFDPNNDEEVVRYLQKAEASDSKFQEAAEVRKAAMNFLEELRKNPRKVLNDPNIGVDLKKLAQEIMSEELQEAEKTPEQREREKLQRELEEAKRKLDEEKKAWEQKEFERLQTQHEQQLETDISAALDIGGLPKTARTVKAMAEMMMIALENGIELSPQEIVPIVKNTTLSEFKEVMNSLTDDQLEDYIGKDIIGRIRKRSVAKAKTVAETAKDIKATGESQQNKKTEDNKPVKKQTIREFLKV